MNKLPSFLDIYAAAAKSNLSMGSAYLQGVRRIRQCQIDQINASSVECESILNQLESLDDMGALGALHAKVINLQMERAASYWTEVQREMGALQTELSTKLQGYTASVGDELRHHAEVLQAEVAQGATNLLTPMWDPQSTFAFATYEKAHEDRSDRAASGHHNGSDYAHARRSSSKSARGERAA